LDPNPSILLAPDAAGQAESVRKAGKVSVEKMRTAILALCDGRYMTPGELSGLLGRKHDTLRNGYLSKLVREGQLELRYPEAPSHPDQAYRARPVSRETEAT
jgi:ATP-dependent DNA helicase RecG